jgi:arginine/lysine/ornithine decarboxylase
MNLVKGSNHAPHGGIQGQVECSTEVVIRTEKGEVYGVKAIKEEHGKITGKIVLKYTNYDGQNTNESQCDSQTEHNGDKITFDNNYVHETIIHSDRWMM